MIGMASEPPEGDKPEDRYCVRCGAELFDDQKPGLCDTCVGDAKRGAHSMPQWLKQHPEYIDQIK